MKASLNFVSDDEDLLHGANGGGSLRSNVSLVGGYEHEPRVGCLQRPSQLVFSKVGVDEVDDTTGRNDAVIDDDALNCIGSVEGDDLAFPESSLDESARNTVSEAPELGISHGVASESVLKSDAVGESVDIGEREVGEVSFVERDIRERTGDDGSSWDSARGAQHE